MESSCVTDRMQQRGKGSRRAARLLRARWPARCGCAGADEAAVAVAGYGSAGTGRGGRRPVSQMLKLSLSHPRTPKKAIRGGPITDPRGTMAAPLETNPIH